MNRMIPLDSFVLCLFVLCLLATSVDCTEERRRPKQKHKHTDSHNPKMLRTFSNNTIELSKAKMLQKFQEDSPLYSDWSPWTKCQVCWQRRQRQCLNFKCRDFKVFEERPCDRKRCKRKQRKSDPYQLHIVHLQREKPPSTKNSRAQIWSRWSDWTQCNSECKAFRFRVCRKPGRCKKRKQRQTAFCYHEQTNCEHFVINLIGSRRESNIKYEYGGGNYQTAADKSEPPKGKCGRPNRKAKMMKIIGGKESKKYKWPWHVAVINRYMEVFCAGTLIHPKWVLTAAHCVRTYLRVRLNEHDLGAKDGREMEMSVSKMFMHPKFNQQTVDNDIALLQLPKAVKLPVACLPTSKPIGTELCSVMGWGKKKASDFYGTSILHEAEIPIVNTSVCTRAYRQYYLSNNMFCAGWSSGVADTCAGDSGGGLMCPKKRGRDAVYSVQGITSFGDGCGRKNKFGIYTTVYNYLNWIQYTIDNYS